MCIHILKCVLYDEVVRHSRALTYHLLFEKFPLDNSSKGPHMLSHDLYYLPRVRFDPSPLVISVHCSHKTLYSEFHATWSCVTLP